MKKLMARVATTGARKTKISCPSFETVKQEVERIMREQHLTLRGAIAMVKREHRFRDLAERLGFGANESEVAL